VRLVVPAIFAISWMDQSTTSSFRCPLGRPHPARQSDSNLDFS
jgi:hypothetical protein